jgi:hypothetical protein
MQVSHPTNALRFPQYDAPARAPDGAFEMRSRRDRSGTTCDGSFLVRLDVFYQQKDVTL